VEQNNLNGNTIPPVNGTPIMIAARHKINSNNKDNILLEYSPNMRAVGKLVM
jgi:hypothetical protein